MFFYYQQNGGEEGWKAVPASHREKLEAESHPTFITALAVSKLVEDLSSEEKLKLAYAGPYYADWDSEDEALVIDKVNQFLDSLVELGVDLEMVRLFATGGRGYHLEMSQKLFMETIPKSGYVGLPSVYREMSMALVVDTLDMKVYSSGRGRMWRTPNVQRSNGRYKVQISVAEMREMTPELCRALTSTPRECWAARPPEFCVKLSLIFSRADQKVQELLKRRSRFKPDPRLREKASSFSVQWMMAGLGIKEGVGFQNIAMQLACAAVAAGMAEELFIVECAGLINNHVGDGSRYGTPEKRAEELRRMHRYMDGNICYEFSVPALKALLSHAAPDLDGIVASKEDVKQVIDDAALDDPEVVDEYGDVAKGVTLAKYGIYMDTEFGKKRICALSFANAAVLRSADASQIIGYDSDVVVNGVFSGRATLEVDIFSGLVPFNRFVSKYGHAFQGTDAQVRVVMMRFVEQAKKKGNMRYVVAREGLDMVSIPLHENARLRQPFLVWADVRGVIPEPEVVETGIEMKFAGYPDPRGVFRTDITEAPDLAGWLREGDNKATMRDMLENLMSCQRPEVLGKLLGWYTACFFKPLFQRAYGKFPLLHVNGPAGLGKCLGRDTPVLLADGTAVMVQDVRTGDQLLGPDGGVRNVRSVCSGREMLYRVTPVKGDPYVVNESHILSLKKSGKDGCVLSDGTYVTPSADIVNVNVKVFADSLPVTRKALKGWRSGALEFNRKQEPLPLDPYWLGLWLGDGRAVEPSICKPDGPVVRWWVEHAESFGYSVSEYGYREGECPSWYVKSGRNGKPNRFTDLLRAYRLLGDKHIPDAYKFAPLEDRLRLLAGLIDTDGHLIDSNFEWVSKCSTLAQDFAFVCRSVGLACYVKEIRKGIKSRGFVGTYWKCIVSGDTDKVPCLVKRAAPRRQIKRVTVTGITVEPIGVGDYFGFELDGDKLFLLGDFTVTHNTEMQTTISSLFYWQAEARPLSPGSTNFALNQHLQASASIPLILDEYKPHEMLKTRHDAIKGMFRDVYNQRDVARGGGTRESEDYRMLQFMQLAAPLVFIAEAAEDESAVMERVVLVTLARPPQIQNLKNLARFQAFRRNRNLLGILGKNLIARILTEMTQDSFAAEFDEMYVEAQQRYMLTEADLENGKLTADEIQDKQNAKERPVYNHTVAKFGFQQLRKIVKEMFGEALEPLMGELEDGIYSRLSDMNAATTPEYVKVLKQISAMSYDVDPARPDAIRRGFEYAHATMGGRDVVELQAHNSYTRYRMYCRSSGTPTLFQSAEAFAHAIKDSPAFIKTAMGEILKTPRIYFFDAGELARLGVDVFKS